MMGPAKQGKQVAAGRLLSKWPLVGQDIVYLANDWRTDNKTSSHHIAEELAKANHLLFVETGGMRRVRASGHDLGRIVRKLHRWLIGPREQDGMTVCTLFFLPFGESPITVWLNRLLTKWAICRGCRRLRMRQPIVWTLFPHVHSWVDVVDRRLLVYYVVDDYSAMPLVDAQHIRRCEAAMLTGADVVFAASRAVANRLRKDHPNVHYSPHGVDLDHFSPATNRNGAVPPELASMTRPIIGFHGLIEEWVDLDLVARLAKQRPEWSFVFVGRLARNASAVKNLRNVYLLGHRPYGELPAYLRAFDIGMLPYVLNSQVQASNPKKLREFLAAGLPVVSVRVPEVELYSPPVIIADGCDEFLAGLDRAVASLGTHASAFWQRPVLNESWERRVVTIGASVAEALERGMSEQPSGGALGRR